MRDNSQLHQHIDDVTTRPQSGIAWGVPPIQEQHVIPHSIDCLWIQPSSISSSQLAVPVPTSISDSSQWSTIVSRHWSFNEHINALELRSVLTAIRWLMTKPSSMYHRVAMLIDSAVGYYVLKKGRSSSSQLLLLHRKIAALLLVGGITVVPLWISTSANPADVASRC